MAKDLYEILEVERDVSASGLKSSYRGLARRYHPDANPDDPEAESNFKEIAAAYEVLSDPERRNNYDRFGHTGQGAPAGDPFGGFGDIFNSFFGGQQNGPRVASGEDLETVLTLSFEEAVFGTEATVEVRTAVACQTCEATGATPGSEAVTCHTCHGAGQVQRVRQSILGQTVSNTLCPTCNGAGTTIAKPCQECSGEGRNIEEASYTIDVQAGVDEGASLRLTGRGAVGPRGGPAGDLYVRLRVEDHPVFERHGYDLVHRMHLPVTQAVFGVTMPYETLDGDETLTIAAGTQTGKIIRLRGKGVPHVSGRGRGDLLIEVTVDTPLSLTEEQETLLRKFAEERQEEVSPPDEGFISRVRSALR